jgi:ribosome-binding factor A
MGKQRERRIKQTRENEGARTLRLQELIREEVNLLLRNEVRDPRLAGVEITMVELTGDGSCARLWFTADEERSDVGEACERVAGFLRTELAESLGLKRTPELRFRRDPTTRRLAPAQEEKERET